MKLFHGTTFDNLANIRKNGLRTEKGGANWTCSDEYVYFWSPKELEESGDTKEGDGEREAFQRAFDSAQVSLGFSKSCRAVVLEIELDESLLEQVEPDSSCDNMTGAVRVPSDVPFSAIKKISVSSDLGSLRGYFLALMENRPLLARDFTPFEKKIAKIFKSAEIYPEDIEELCNWKEV
jgi:hypothetical protein